MSKPNKATKAKAASTRREQLRAQQLAEAKKKQRMMRVIYAVCAVVALGLIAVVGVVVYNDRQAKKEQAEREKASQITPPSANNERTGLIWNPAKAGDDVPLLTIYEDFQCPACKQTEDYFGETINKLAEDGKVRVEYRVLTFLDANLRNDSSERSARAASCADTVGSFKKYHDVVFANQPQEGAGYTDAQLTGDFAQKAGITGENLTKFQSCYNDKATSKWVADAYKNGSEGWLGSTPQININGKNPKVQGDSGETDWWRVLEANEESWIKAIEQHK